MVFLGHLLTAAVQFVLLLIISVGGVLVGKKLRENKTAKSSK